MKKIVFFNNIFRFRFFLIVGCIFLGFTFLLCHSYELSKNVKNHLFEEKIIEQLSQKPPTDKKNKSVVSQKQKNIIPLNWKVFDNSRIGISFHYPDSWTKFGDESNSINQNGEVMSVLVNYHDTIANSFFSIEYHLAPYGTKLYKYAQSQFNSSQGLYEKDAKQIIVAGNKAFVANSILRIDGKGNALNPEIKSVIVVMLDKKQTGEIELQFKTPLPNSNAEVAKFSQLLSTIKFIN